MTIDIITFTDEQFAALSEAQIQEIKNVQTEKDELTAALAEKKSKEKYRLLENGIYRSGIYKLIATKLDEEYNAEVERLREGLLFYLRFSSKAEESVTENAPYTVDYSLTYQERYEVVSTYYMDTYSDAAERFETFKADKLAPNYLGEFYATLYDYLQELAA